jgi:hypothetical protein
MTQVELRSRNAAEDFSANGFIFHQTSCGVGLGVVIPYDDLLRAPRLSS